MQFTEIPQDVLRYSTLQYLPFREIYLLRGRYPREYQRRLEEFLNLPTGHPEILLTALEFKDNQLLDRLLDRLLPIPIRGVYTDEGETLRKLYDSLDEIYRYFMDTHNQYAIALILSTNGDTGSSRYNQWIGYTNQLDYPFHTLEDPTATQILLSDEVVDSIDDDLTYIYANALIEMDNFPIEDQQKLQTTVRRLIQTRGYIPSGMLDVGITEQELLDLIGGI